MAKYKTRLSRFDKFVMALGACGYILPELHRYPHTRKISRLDGHRMDFYERTTSLVPEPDQHPLVYVPPKEIKLDGGDTLVCIDYEDYREPREVYIYGSKVGRFLFWNIFREITEPGCQGKEKVRFSEETLATREQGIQRRDKVRKHLKEN